MPKIINIPTDKFGERADGVAPSLLIIHSIGMPVDSALDLLTANPREVSCHYLISSKGQIFSMVPEDKRAWHAGKSSWRGHKDINSTSIGIELQWSDEHEANEELDIPGPFPDVQMDALVELCKAICARWNITPENILGHSDIAPGRKRDPGERFDWKRLAAEGLALLPTRPLPMPPGGDLEDLLARLGYDVRDPQAAIIAFQRHYRQRDCTGLTDSETRSLLQWLVNKTGR